MKVVILRTQRNEFQTIGTGLVYDESGQMLASFATLELGWNDNRKKVSSIPLGEYRVIKRRSERFGTHFHIQDVPNRDLVLIHVGNYHMQTQGCILVGQKHQYLNTDTLLDVSGSLVTMKLLVQILPATFDLKIIEL